MDMKSQLAVMAKYNRIANEALFGILSGLPEGEVMKPRGSFFGSIHGVLSHIYSGDVNWLRRFRDFFGSLDAFLSPRLDPPGAAWTGYSFATFAELATARRDVDAILEAFVSQAEGGRYGETMRYVDSHGTPRAFTAGSLVLHLFNHETHHRGQVSQMLDEMGIAHDFSNVISALDPR